MPRDYSYALRWFWVMLLCAFLAIGCSNLPGTQPGETQTPSIVPTLPLLTHTQTPGVESTPTQPTETPPLVETSTQSITIIPGHDSSNLHPEP